MAESNIQTKIAALLRQAEKAGTPEESATYQAKAQELSVRYSIDMELARAADIRNTRRPVLTRQSLRIGDRGSRSLMTYIDLFCAIARQNNVKVTMSHDRTYVHAHGFDTDVETTLALYTSLITQMVRESDAYLRAGTFKTETVWRDSTDKWDSRKQEYVYTPAGYYPVHGKTARRSFQEAFTSKISQRLREARLHAEQAAANAATSHFHAESEADAQIHAATTSDSVALALQTRKEEVELFFKKMNPRLGTARRSTSSSFSSHAHNAGTQAGARARISQSRAIGGSRSALSA